MNTRKKKKMLLIWTSWLLIVSNLFSITAYAGVAPIYNQSGFGYSGTISAAPIGDTVGMTGYSDWPAGFTQNNSFAGGIFDGDNIWMLPAGAAGLLKIDKDTGAMEGYTAWPSGFSRSSSNPDFLSGVFDGQNIWMIPYGADRVIKVDKDTGVMTGYSDWPSGFILPSTVTNPNPMIRPQPNFSGGVFDGQNIWMVPAGANYVIKINKDTGAMTGYNNWPSDVQLPSQGVSTPNGFILNNNFNGGIFDGQSMWMVPNGADRVVKIDTDTGAMTSYSDWPSGFTKDFTSSQGFNGGIFDGQNIWLVPNGADRVIKIDKDTGVMTGYDNWPSSLPSGSKRSTGVFDGQSIWLLPGALMDQIVKLDTDTGAMTAFNNWPSTTMLGMVPFNGGVFDGESIWMMPSTANQVVKLGEVNVPVTGVTVSPATLTLTAEGNTATVTATVSPSNATNKKVTWTSSNPLVATVDEDGVVTPLTAGTVTITATTEDGSETATSTVTINEADVLVTGVTVSPATLTLTAGGSTGTLTAGVSPSNATNKKVTWTSSDPSVATVDEDGVVTPLRAGTVTITGTTEDGGRTATSTVTVNETDVAVTGVTVSPAALTLTAGGGTGTVTAGVSPSNATNAKVTWTSSDPSVATVDEEGVVTPLRAGTVTITGTTDDGGKTAISTVTVNAPGTSAPTALIATAGNGTVTLNWTGVQGSVSYSVYQSTTAGDYGSVPIAVVSSENFTVTGLTNGTTYYFKVKANDEEGVGSYSNEASATPRAGSQGSGGDSSSGGNGTSGSSAIGGQVALEGFRVIVNGKEYDQIAAGNTTKQDGKSILTATVDTNKLTAQLAKEGGHSTIIIPVASVSADKVSTVLTGDAVKAMENNEAILEVRTINGNYKLPASEIAIDSLSSLLGVQVKLTDIVVQVDIAKSNDASIQLVKNTAGKDGFSVVLPPVDFTVTASYNGKTVVVDKFSSYVQREIPLPAGIDLSKITTATVLLEDGTVYHVPTYVTQHDKNYYAVVSSLTNSTYTLIWNPITFADVVGHWSQDAVNDMGSRIIVKGIDETHYNPNAAITRSEFSAIIVRALGLAENGKTTAFNDVLSGDWYMGAVAKAQEYGIIKGYEDGAFRPNKTITRQEAMVMLERAMKLTGLNTTVSEAEAASALASFTDGTAVDAWAKQAVAATINSGLVQGRDAGLKPTSNITRAETAVIVQRMLIKAELIDLGNSK
ncbi:Ig-like domain-containing protein [Paenibacillus algorifonticola]|uniref:Ig-like domain-containing protein n=1 Tax=Paenibacillus algorifonticola TaxID=684063 RepID=UPI003D2AA705